MRKYLVLLFIFTGLYTLQAQSKCSFGIGAGLTASKPAYQQKDIYGKLEAGYGFNFYFPVMYNLGYAPGKKRFRTFFLESGLGYYCNAYRFTYHGLFLVNRNCHPYLPLKFKIEKMITPTLALVTGMGGAVDFFPINMTTWSTDSLSKTTCVTSLPGKMNAYLSLEFGIQKHTRSGKTHLLNLQFYYGLGTVANGKAYHYDAPNSATTYAYKGSFISMNYAFLFRRQNAFPGTDLNR